MSGIIAQNVGRHTGLVKAADAGGGAWTLIQTLTSDGSDADLSFTSGLDDTYDVYCFIFTYIHLETADDHFQFNASDDGGSNYDLSKIGTFFRGYHNEAGAAGTFNYDSGQDIAGTGHGTLISYADVSNDSNGGGEFYLWNPSSDTFTKHFSSRIVSQQNDANPYMYDNHIAGYINTADAVNAVQFKASSGEIQAGTISLFGLG